MKTFWKVFIVSFLCFSIAIVLGSYSYVKINQSSLNSNIGGGQYGIGEDREDSSKEEDKAYSSLEEAFKDSSRVNVVLLGMEDVRTDTIMFASFDPVALDKACADAANKQPVIPGSLLSEKDQCHSDHFTNTHPSTNWISCLEHAVKLGIGSMEYELIDIG